MSRREQRKLERLKKKKKRKTRLKLAILIIAIGIFFSKSDIIKSQNIFIIQNKTLPAKENEIEIKYFNRVINLFLKGRMYDKLIKDDSNYLKILKNFRGTKDGKDNCSENF